MPSVPPPVIYVLPISVFNDNIFSTDLSPLTAATAATVADEATTYTQVLTSHFNSDGAADIFAYSPTTAESFLGDGYGNFTPTNSSATCPTPTDGGVAVADVNFDSAPDIICVAATPTPCLNDGTGHFTPATALEPDPINSHCSTLAAQHQR